MRKQILNFFYSPLYIIFLVLITLVSWTFSLQLLGLSVICLLFVCVLVFLKDTSPLIPLILFSCIIFSKSYRDINTSLLYLIYVPFLLFSFIFYFVKNKTKLEKGKYFYGLLFAAMSITLGGLFYDSDISHFLFAGGLSFLIVFLYSFFYTTSTAENLKKLFISAAIGVVCVILAQISIYYLRSQDNYLQELSYKRIDLGWGNSNNAAFMLCIFLPVVFSLSIKSKYNSLFVLFAFLMLIGILFTLSRGNFLIGVIMFAVLSLVGLKKTSFKLNYTICLIGIFILCLFVLFSNLECFAVIKDNFSTKGFGDNGRFELWQKGWNDFIANPIFGVGFYKDFMVERGLPLLYHNTFFQIIASLGLVGIAGFILFFIQRYTIPFKNFNLNNFYMFSIIIISELFGIIDANFTFIYNALIVIIVYVILEKEPFTVNLFLKSKKKTEN